MDELKELLVNMREIMDLADLEDEVKERGEKNLQDIEVVFEEATKREPEPEVVVEPAEVREVVDLTPVVQELTEAVKGLAEGQREIVESLKTAPIEEVVPEPEESREVEVEEEVSPEPDLNEKRYAKLEDMVSDLTTLVRDTVPVRRGVGPDDGEQTPDELDRVKAKLEEIEDPEMRLRGLFGHMSGERPIVV